MALTVLWLIAGALPGLHLHDSDVALEVHGHDSELKASTHLEASEESHPEACRLCSMMLSFDGFERPRATVASKPVELAIESSGTKALGFPGRHGESRAPPLV